MDWIKLYTRKWLWGSGRTMTPEKRGVWVDLLALAAEAKMRDGTLRFDEGQPMPRTWIANSLIIPLETLDACLAAYQADINVDDGNPRITIWGDGTIAITNWEKFQGKPEKVIAKEVSIEKAKETKRRQEVAVTAQLRLTNELQSVIKKLEGAGVQIPIKCPYCDKQDIKDKITLARHISQAEGDSHTPALGWANEFLNKGGE